MLTTSVLIVAVYFLKRLGKRQKTPLKFVKLSGLIMISLKRITLAILAVAGTTLIVSSSFARANDGTNVEFRQISPDQPNEIVFEPQEANSLRFSIYASQNNSPAIDELLVFGPSDESENLAQRKDATVSATSCIAGYAIHRIENLIDGKYGNGEDRKVRLKAAGYDPAEVQRIVNRMVM